MSRGDLRKDINARFGAFVKAQGLREISYDYNEQLFGNEMLELENDKVGIRFVRDRSQIGIDLRRKDGSYEPIHLLLLQLGVPEPILPPDWIPRAGFLFGADQLVPEWPRLEHLVCSQY